MAIKMQAKDSTGYKIGLDKNYLEDNGYEVSSDMASSICGILELKVMTSELTLADQVLAAMAKNKQD
jgi:hypothetical protein